MKPHSRILLLITVAAGIAASSLQAGPGADYWTRQAKRRDAATQAREASVAVLPADAKRVEITETKNSWHNERGPAVTRVVGYKMVSSSHKVWTAKRSGPNGKGPLIMVSEDVRDDLTGVMPLEK